MAAAYVAAMLLFIYGIANESVGYGSDFANVAVVVGLALLHVAAGWFANSWWIILLPVIAVVSAVPAGYPENNGGEPLPIWFGLAVFTPVGTTLIAAGVLTRRLVTRAA